MEPNKWTEIVEEREQTFVANTIEEIAEVFGDHELIQSLGCESVMNVPINIRGQVVGTLNCLNVAGHFTPERVAASEALKVPGALAFDGTTSRGMRSMKTLRVATDVGGTFPIWCLKRTDGVRISSASRTPPGRNRRDQGAGEGIDPSTIDYGLRDGCDQRLTER